MPSIKSRFWFITYNNPEEPWRSRAEELKADWFIG